MLFSCGAVFYSATDSVVQPNRYCGELVFNEHSNCSKCVCVWACVCTLTWKYQHVWCVSISRNIIHSVAYVRSCSKVCVKTYRINTFCAIKFYHLQRQVLMLQEYTRTVDRLQKPGVCLCSCSSSFSIWLFVQGQCVATAYLYIDKIGSM